MFPFYITSAVRKYPCNPMFEPFSLKCNTKSHSSGILVLLLFNAGWPASTDNLDLFCFARPSSLSSKLILFSRLFFRPSDSPLLTGPRPTLLAAMKALEFFLTCILLCIRSEPCRHNVVFFCLATVRLILKLQCNVWQPVPRTAVSFNPPSALSSSSSSHAMPSTP